MNRSVEQRIRQFLVWMVEDGYEINWDYQDGKIIIYDDTVNARC